MLALVEGRNHNNPNPPAVDDPSIDADTEDEGNGGIGGDGNQVNVIAYPCISLT